MLAAPRIVAPVSPCSRHVRLQGQLTGATVELIGGVSGVVVQAQAQGPDELFALSRSLAPGETLRARQELGGVGSDFSRTPVRVIGPPGAGDLRRPRLASHLYVCALHLRVEGAFPGADVELLDATGNVRGAEESVDGVARVALNAPLGAGERLSVRQTACGLAGQSPSWPEGEPAPLDPEEERLPAPIVEGPLTACQTRVRVRDLLDGSTVTLTVNGDELRYGCDASRLTLLLPRPLAQGDRLSIRQEFPRCELRSRDRDGPEVGPVRVPRPWVPTPVCHRDWGVLVNGLVPGALVRFRLPGSEDDFAVAEAWDGSCDFELPDLHGVDELLVSQGLCDPPIWSDPVGVAVEDQHLGDPDPRIEEPIVACGQVVHVTGVGPGDVVEIHSDARQGAIASVRALDYELDVPLKLPLLAGDRVWVVDYRCGERLDSDGVEVGEAGDLAAPQVAEPVCDCGGGVHVVDVAPGARVEVYVDGRFAAAAPVSGREGLVPLPHPLRGGERVKARQLLCSQVSAFGEERYADDLAHVRVRHPVRRICQLTGDYDPEGHAHVNDTAQFGVVGTDLGVPVEHDGRLYLFFGDAAGDNFDPIASTVATSVEPHGFRMSVLLRGPTDPRFRPLTVPALGDLPALSTPCGGFGFDGRAYVFVNHDPGTGVAAGSHTFLTSAADPARDFALHPGLPLTLPTAAVVRNADWPGLPAGTEHGALIWGWRDDPIHVYLAHLPLAPGAELPTFDDVADVTRFDDVVTYYSNSHGWAGLDDATPLFGLPQLTLLNAAWIPGLERWAIVYSTGYDPALLAGVGPDDYRKPLVARFARLPWGFGEAPEVTLFDPEPGADAGFARFMHDPQASPSDGLEQLAPADYPGQVGWAYSPMILPRFTRWSAYHRRATVYFLISTNRPYQVQLMRVELECE